MVALPVARSVDEFVLGAGVAVAVEMIKIGCEALPVRVVTIRVKSSVGFVWLADEAQSRERGLKHCTHVSEWSPPGQDVGEPVLYGKET